MTPIPIGDPPPELAAQRSNFRGYALGLGVSDYRGRKLLAHTGGLPGYVSRVMMVPEIKLGVAVLTNQESGGRLRCDRLPHRRSLPRRARRRTGWRRIGSWSRGADAGVDDTDSKTAEGA